MTSTGSHEVTLENISEAFLKLPVKIKATVRGYAKYEYVNWMKNNQGIDIIDPN